MFWSFLTLWILIWIILIWLIVWTCKKFKRIYKMQTKNIFRLLQFILLLYVLIMWVASFLIKFISDFQLQNYPFFLHVYFSFYFSEITNLSWWIVFLFHIKAYSGHIINKQIIRNVKRKEKIFAFILVVILIFSIILVIVFQVISFVYDCSDWAPFYKIEECEGHWKSLAQIFKTQFLVLIYLGICLICL